MKASDCLPNRKNIRLKNYDYRSNGVYHVTICARNHECILGEIVDRQMRFSPIGSIVERNILDIPAHYPEAEVIAHVTMPNHVHLLLGLGTKEDANYGVPTARPDVDSGANGTVVHSLGQIIRAYKASVSMACGQQIWQARFYEHIIRNECDLVETMTYIQNNPAAWELDELF